MGLFSKSLKAASDAMTAPSTVAFGPGKPMTPATPDEPIRREQYLPNRNMIWTPRLAEGRTTTFAQLRGLSRTHGVLRTLIEKRKDEIKALDWDVTVKKEFKTQNNDFQDERIAARKFLNKPDQDAWFDQWLAAFMEDTLVIDAATIYWNMSKGGDLISMDIVDGSTINILIDDRGRIPNAPEVAYEQVIWGRPATWWTKEELFYHPYNRPSDGLYGFSHVESILMTINTALRRDVQMLRFFTDGNIPWALVEIPQGWTADQMERAQAVFDNLLTGDLANRSKMQLAPSAKVHEFGALTFDAIFDEWLARVMCARFGVSPAPYVRMMNRATAEAIDDSATDEAFIPMMQHIKRVFDIALEKRGQPYLEFTWTTGQLKYRLDDAQITDLMISKGGVTIDDMRELKGYDPYPNGLGSHPMIFTPNGPILLADVVSGKFIAPAAAQAGAESLEMIGDAIEKVGLAANPQPAEVDPINIDNIANELNTWERFAGKRMKENKGFRVFATKALPPQICADINIKVKGCKTQAELKEVFDAARQGLGRSRRLKPNEDGMVEIMSNYQANLHDATQQAIDKLKEKNDAARETSKV